MIIKNYCADELVGLFARVKKTLVGKNKKTVDVGTIVFVLSVSDKRTQKYVDVKTTPCQYCGQYSVIDHVECSSLEVIDTLPFDLPVVSLSERKIPRGMTADKLTGNTCRVNRHIQNGRGEGVTPRTICKITAAHYGICIQADKCPVCGRSSHISRIKRDDVLLIDA